MPSPVDPSKPKSLPGRGQPPPTTCTAATSTPTSTPPLRYTNGRPADSAYMIVCDRPSVTSLSLGSAFLGSIPLLGELPLFTSTVIVSASTRPSCPFTPGAGEKPVGPNR